MMENMTFEQAGQALDDILQELSCEDTPLERSLALYAQAAQLISFCDDTLKNAQMRVDEIDAQYAPTLDRQDEE
jgi:exodeoxyribonuclease VII small subunit